MAYTPDFDMDDQPAAREHAGTAFGEILRRRVSRRGLLKGSALLGLQASWPGFARAPGAGGRPPFRELAHGLDETLHVAEGYSCQVLLRWGDPLFADAPAFDPAHQHPEAQARQFGYNNDFVEWLPLPRGGDSSGSGLLVVNHEFVSSSMMHPGAPRARDLSRDQVDTEMQALGLSVVEVHRQQGAWQVQRASAYNRRITPHTVMRFFRARTGDPQGPHVVLPAGHPEPGHLRQLCGQPHALGDGAHGRGKRAVLFHGRGESHGGAPGLRAVWHAGDADGEVRLGAVS